MPLDPLDRGAQKVLDIVRAAGRPPFEMLTPAEARAAYKAGRKVLSPEPLALPAVRDLEMPGPAGSLGLRLYRGSAAAILPALVFFHGGGWVVGDLDTHDEMCRHLAARAHCAVLAVDYRLAPEAKFPAAVEDCFAATCWAAANAARLGIDPARLAVGGDSAGGNLAAVVSLMARDRGAPRLAYQLLIYPATDAGMGHPSIARLAEGHLLTQATMRWFYDQYLAASADGADWRASPLLAPDLARVAPAYVLTAGYDPLADEGEAYARRLAEAGVPVRWRRYSDQIHGFCQNGKIIPAAYGALDEAAAALEAGWG